MQDYLVSRRKEEGLRRWRGRKRQSHRQRGDEWVSWCVNERMDGWVDAVLHPACVGRQGLSSTEGVASC